MVETKLFIMCASDPERKGRNGVALIFNSLKLKLIRHRCQSDRVMVAWLSGRINSETFKIVVCYSPTNPDDEKGENGLIASTLISSE